MKFNLLKHPDGSLTYGQPSELAVTIPQSDYIYDIESYPNVFTCAIERVEDGERWMFEISEWVNDSMQFVQFIRLLGDTRGSRMVGFNNVGFDYPVIHMICNNPIVTPFEINTVVNELIDRDKQFSHMVWEDQRIVPQVDLYLIHHYDNVSKATSLKVTEFNMRLPEIQDLPFTPGTVLTIDQVKVLRDYNWKDVAATHMFYRTSMPEIQFREKISEEVGINFINANDTKIGKDFFASRLQEEGVTCSKGVGTPRPSLALKDCVFDYIHFANPEFNRVKEFIETKVIKETKGVFKNLSATVGGVDFVFGLGGIHACVGSQTIRSDSEYVIRDVDVTSYYPRLGVVNGIYPEHLGEVFPAVYNELFEIRKKYPKKTHPMQNLLYKLALNGTYGDTNNKYGVFYDPKYTMTTTINGQFMLCMLAENCLDIPDLRIIQANTDGITVMLKRSDVLKFEALCEWWESYTGLNLEHVDYSAMYVRDVNNYIAVGVDGSVKRKGAYEYKRFNHQNQSQLIVPLAVEKLLLHGVPVEETIRNHDDLFDFCLRVKTPRRATLADYEGIQYQNMTRYYASADGVELFKTFPPSPRMTPVYYLVDIDGVEHSVVGAQGKNQMLKAGCTLLRTVKEPIMSKESVTAVLKGQTVTVCNNMADAVAPVDYDFYIAEAYKLIDPLS